MKKVILLALLALLVTPAGAQVLAPAGKPGVHYLRWMDIRHPQIAALTLFNLNDRAMFGGLADVAIITHSTLDGTMIPKTLQPYVPPAAWVPLQAGVGGNLSSRVIVHLGSSYNVGWTLATSIVKIAGLSTSPTGEAVKQLFSDGMELGDAGTLGFYVGIGMAANVVDDGHFQSVKAMFPGQGLGPVLQNAAKYSLGLSFKPK